MSTLVHKLARAGDLVGLGLLLQSNPLLAQSHEGQNGPIHSAASNDQDGAIALLLNKGANVNSRNQDGMTPLHCAADGNFKAAKVLIESGAELDALFNGYTPAALALSGQTAEGFEIAQLLFSSGAQQGLRIACILR